MNSRVKKYLLYISLIIIAGILLFLLVQTVKAKNTGFETKTLWDWMELFIIPLFLAGGAFYLDRSERESERQRAEERAKLEREFATDRQQEAALQAYLDRMADLLLKEKIRTTKNKEVRDVARTRTLSVLRGLDGKRKRTVLYFIREAGLVSKDKPILDLVGADFSNADLGDFGLGDVNLNGVNLRGANLNHAYLSNAYLYFADLSNADLSNAILSDAKFSDIKEQLKNVASLKNTTMPDGTKHE